MFTDKNNLELSNQSSSGYRFVALYENRFVAFADVPTAELQELNHRFKPICKFYGFKNVVALGEFDDVRDAAYVGQQFYGNGVDERNAKLEDLFNGDTSVIASPPCSWNHDPAFEQIERAKTRTEQRKQAIATGKAIKKLTVQEALFQFYQTNKDAYKVTKDNVPAIRNTMEQMVKQIIGRVNNDDLLQIAEEAFTPFKK